MSKIIIIPARMSSLRLPNKPLADINGLPMIIHVMRRAEQANIAPVYVACCEAEVAETITKHGGKYVMTNPDHPSGSDRIQEAVDKIDPDKKHQIIINLQGDLPNIAPEIINDVTQPFNNPQVDITTLVAKINDVEERTNPNVVKSIISWHDDITGTALYFTRATAPYQVQSNAQSQNNTQSDNHNLYHHIGIYAYRRDALKKFTSLPPSELEKCEKLEQLRALENNMRIDVVKINSVPFGIDTQEDLEKIRGIL